MCEVCIGVYNPLRYKIKNYNGYPIIIDDAQQLSDFKGLRDRARVFCVIKNRYGVTDRLIPVNFLGELGIFRELPPANQITDYTPYLSLTPPQQMMEEEKDEAQEEPTTKERIYTF